MKISVCGKGGSGKSTLAALLAAEFRRRGNRVLVVDSDESNSGLYRMLGLHQPPRPLMELAGGKKNIQKAMRTAFSDEGEYQGTPVLSREKFRLQDLPPDYIGRNNGISLVQIGKIHQALEGCACPMGVLSREFLKKLQTSSGEVVIIDMEAGIEHFGRGVETSIRAVVAAVEPSLDSLELAGKIKSLALASGANFAGSVINKAASSALVKKLTGELRKTAEPLLGVVDFHPEFIDASLEGRPLPHQAAAREIREITDAILNTLDQEAVSQRFIKTPDIGGK